MSSSYVSISDPSAPAAAAAAAASDLGNIALLIFLYFMQGVPLGMTAAVSLLLQAQPEHPADLPKRLALFSTASWPFAFKFVFAPAIDSLRLPWLGVRKTWLLVSQSGIGLALMLASGSVREAVLSADVRLLLALFLPVCLCAAAQDVAVDGWALALLRTPSWASTCNCVGQSMGFVFGTAALTLVDWRMAHTIFWWIGAAFITATIAVLVTKREEGTNQAAAAAAAAAVSTSLASITDSLAQPPASYAHEQNP